MSSILKAMRQTNTHSAQTVASSYRRPEPSEPQGARIGLWALLVLAAILGWLVAPEMGFSDSPGQGTDSEQEVSTAMVLNAPTSIELTALPDAEQPPEVEVETPIRSSASENSDSNQTARTNTQEGEPQSSDAIDLDSVSPELLAAFENAVAATADMTRGAQQQESVMPRLSDLSTEFQRRVPQFSYEAHNYVSADSRRFIVLGGQRLQEGDYFNALQVIRIEPQHVVLALQRQAFRQNALEDWTGTR